MNTFRATEFLKMQQLETALANWLDGQPITDVDINLLDFMENVIEAADDGTLDEVEYWQIRTFAREWIEQRA